MKDNAQFRQLYHDSMVAAMAAGGSAQPIPMHISGYAPVADGVCGFAGVVMRPATSAFAKWLKAMLIARSHYGGGLYINITDFNQSYTRKMAAAEAMAKHLRDKGGVNAHAEGRLD